MSNKSDLTTAQLEKINQNQLCPVCDKGDLVLGPSGGGSSNAKCNNPTCRQEYWLGFGFGDIIWGGTLDRDEPNLYGGGTLREMRHGN